LTAADEETRAARYARLRRLGIGVGSLALGVVLIYSVFPVRTYLDQRSATNRSEEQLDVLSEENDRLAERLERLREDEEIERLAREHYGLVLPGEEAYALTPPPEPTTTIPEP
jgi:cell division protein FtsB